MKSRVSIFVLCLSMMLSSWVQARVTTDYDHHADFSRYQAKTYSWIKVKAENSIWKQRISDAIGNAMTMKGWVEVQSGGDVSLVALGTTKEEHSLQTFYSGFGPGWGWGWGGWGPDMSTTRVDTYEEGTLLVDMYDGKSKQLIWTGVATDTLSNKPDKNEKTLEKDVTKMFKDFPPGSKSKH